MTVFKEPNFPSIFTENFTELRRFDKDLVTVLGELTLNLKGILDGGISFDDNVDAAVVSFTSSAIADANNSVAHTLGKVPNYFIVASIDKGGVVYRDVAPFTSTTIYVRCTVASAAIKLILL